MTLTTILVAAGLVSGACLAVLIVTLGIEQMIRRYRAGKIGDVL